MTFEIDLIETYGMNTALRALRRPMNINPKNTMVPDNEDLRLMSTLVARGDDHAKFARMIGVGFTIRAPRYWWIEFSTYRIGIESVSESTMHRKQNVPFTYEDFEYAAIEKEQLDTINRVREALIIKPDKVNIYELKNMIPEGFLQTRDIIANYQALRHIYFGRKKHKLPHWAKFCEWIETLPYASHLIINGLNS